MPAGSRFCSPMHQHRMAKVGAHDRGLAAAGPMIGQRQIARAGAQVEHGRTARPAARAARSASASTGRSPATADGSQVVAARRSRRTSAARVRPTCRRLAGRGWRRLAGNFAHGWVRSRVRIATFKTAPKSSKLNRKSGISPTSLNRQIGGRTASQISQIHGLEAAVPGLATRSLY